MQYFLVEESAAVSSMVNNVLNKSYVLDYCMAMISSNDNEGADHELCRKIVLGAMTVEEIRVQGTSGINATKPGQFEE